MSHKVRVNVEKGKRGGTYSERVRERRKSRDELTIKESLRKRLGGRIIDGTEVGGRVRGTKKRCRSDRSVTDVITKWNHRQKGCS